jgi:hypothetical protein
MNLKDKEKKINQAKKLSLSLSLSLSHATPKIYKLDENPPNNAATKWGSSGCRRAYRYKSGIAKASGWPS